MASPELLAKIAVIDTMVRRAIVTQCLSSANPKEALEDWTTFLDAMVSISEKKSASVEDGLEYKNYLPTEFATFRDDIVEEFEDSL